MGHFRCYRRTWPRLLSSSSHTTNHFRFSFGRSFWNADRQQMTLQQALLQARGCVSTIEWFYFYYHFLFWLVFLPWWRIRDTPSRKWELSGAISFALCLPYRFDKTQPPQIIPLQEGGAEEEVVVAVEEKEKEVWGQVEEARIRRRRRRKYRRLYIDRYQRKVCALKLCAANFYFVENNFESCLVLNWFSCTISEEQGGDKSDIDFFFILICSIYKLAMCKYHVSDFCSLNRTIHWCLARKRTPWIRLTQSNNQQIDPFPKYG